MLQAIINKILSLDPFAHKYLTLLEGKQFAIICTDLTNQPLYFMCENNMILLTSSIPAHIDVTFRSSYSGFLQYAITKNGRQINITGDLEAAEYLQKLYLHLDIDWEEELSKFTGDTIAYQTMQKLRQLRQYTTDSNHTLVEMVTEYLQEEASILPTAYEIDAFLEEVDELRLRADRLEARIKIYENN